MRLIPKNRKPAPTAPSLAQTDAEAETLFSAAQATSQTATSSAPTNASSEVAAILDPGSVQSTTREPFPEDTTAQAPVPKQHTIRLFKPECGRCTMLFPDVTKQKPFPAKVKAEGEAKFTAGIAKFKPMVKPPSCHHSRGNDMCPAKEWRFIVGLDVVGLANRMLDAEESRDYITVSDIMAKIGTSDDVLQQQFKEVIEAARRARAAQQQARGS